MPGNDVAVEIYVAGDGLNYPAADQTIELHYTGYLPDGTKFDSSRDRRKPFRFKLGADQVIPGLDKGMSQVRFGCTDINNLF